MSSTGPLTPEVAVVVASHGRELRLRWLLNALEDQTLDRRRWELIVVHDYGPDMAQALRRHPLATGGGGLRELAVRPGTGSPARQRNLGWRQARAPLVAFTDDDCRPDPRWLEELVAAAARHPGALVQGRTLPDPLEAGHLRAAHWRTLAVEPPNRFAQTCNISYPRSTLERLGGFDERAITGEDVELAARARRAGVRRIGEPAALVYHAIESSGLVGAVRHKLKWRHLAYAVKRRPELRRDCTLGIFWEPDHARTALAGVALAVARRNRVALVATLPWLAARLGRRGVGVRQLLAAAVELPGQAAVDVAELSIFCAGSARHRTLLL